jgi:hypothetical protein
MTYAKVLRSVIQRWTIGHNKNQRHSKGRRLTHSRSSALLNGHEIFLQKLIFLNQFFSTSSLHRNELVETSHAKFEAHTAKL